MTSRHRPIAHRGAGQGAGGNGLLLGALGVGAIAGAVLLPRIRTRLSTNALLVAGSGAYAAALLALVRNAGVILVVLLLAGSAWLAVLASINAALQLFLPAWARARGLSIYQMVLFGARAGGAVLCGLLASPLGLVTTFLLAAVVLVAGAATLRWWPLLDTQGLDRSRAVYWPEPQLVLAPDPDSGPVVVTSTYTVALENEAPFLQAMALVRLSRLRTGPTRWGLFRDGDTAHCFVEIFVVPSWEEHLWQHQERLTGADRQYEAQANALSEPPPQTAHLIAVEPTLGASETIGRIYE